MSQVKITVSVPEEYRDHLVEIGFMLRSDATFGKRLEAFVAESRNPTLAALVSEISKRLDRFERRIDHLDSDLRTVGQGGPVGPDPAWTTGQGAGKRLTEAGDAELIRLVGLGMSDVDIGKRMGLSNLVVRRRRRRYEFETSAQPN